MTCDWRPVDRARLGEGVIENGARVGVVEDVGMFNVRTAGEDRLVES